MNANKTHTEAFLHSARERAARNPTIYSEIQQQADTHTTAATTRAAKKRKNSEQNTDSNKANRTQLSQNAANNNSSDGEQIENERTEKHQSAGAPVLPLYPPWVSVPEITRHNDPSSWETAWD
eukprot:2137606-Rhodomonas_salina.1